MKLISVDASRPENIVLSTICNRVAIRSLSISNCEPPNEHRISSYLYCSVQARPFRAADKRVPRGSGTAVVNGHNNMWRDDKTLLNNRQAWICHRRERGRDVYLHTVDIVGHSHASSAAINVIYASLRLIGRPVLIEEQLARADQIDYHLLVSTDCLITSFRVMAK